MGHRYLSRYWDEPGKQVYPSQQFTAFYPAGIESGGAPASPCIITGAGIISRETVRAASSVR
jgi:hypothetical protein